MSHEPPYDASIELGIHGIDAEHREQLARMNQIVLAMASGHPQDTLANDLGSLIGYLEAHFLSEQIVMREHAYPGYQAHQAEHDEAIATMRGIEERFLAGELKASEDLVLALRGWLVSHIQSTDRALAGYLSSKGVALP